MSDGNERSEEEKEIFRTTEENELEWEDAQHLLDLRCRSIVFWNKLAEAVKWAERGSLEYLETRIREVKTRLAAQGKMTLGLTSKIEMCFKQWEDVLEEWDRKQDDLRGVLRKVPDDRPDSDDEGR
ncbi:unnamed protein product [Gongylonema pulchrum]|uniref:Uncharacterized protein n=1 Tax=Gongylonema pulchrum TaxID=637853 RepID=A0A183E3H1_9BILA|nr:unnamed protein product [Gongylonema pulchrum]